MLFPTNQVIGMKPPFVIACIQGAMIGGICFSALANFSKMRWVGWPHPQQSPKTENDHMLTTAYESFFDIGMV
jgi:hypothetical protein